MTKTSNWTPTEVRPGDPTSPVVNVYSKDKTLEYFRMAEEKAQRLPNQNDAFNAANQSPAQLRAEIERLRGIQPELPPREPDGEGLPRYGLRWNGPCEPVAVPMDDGYWTPWHLAAKAHADEPESKS